MPNDGSSRSGRIELPFADMQGAGERGKYVFRLDIERVRELQEKCDAGPQRIMRRLFDGSWLVDDVIQPVRLGLIGGGMSALDAARLTERYVPDGALTDHVGTAAQIIAACLSSSTVEPIKKKRRRKKTATPSTPEASSTSPPSTNSDPH